jgi:hypothetical protein
VNATLIDIINNGSKKSDTAFRVILSYSTFDVLGAWAQLYLLHDRSAGNGGADV